jgi:hypothetical protein
VAEELGDDDEVDAAAHERGRERVPQNVDGRVVIEPSGRRDRVGARTLSRCPRWLRNGAALSFAPGQSARSASQPVIASRSCGWSGMWRTRSPLPRIRRTPLRAERATSSVSSATISLIRAPA